MANAIETLNQMNAEFQAARAAVKARYDSLPMQQHANLMRRTGTTNLQDAYDVQAKRDLRAAKWADVTRGDGF